MRRRNPATRGARHPVIVERLVHIRGREVWGECAGRSTRAEAESYVAAQQAGEFRIRERGKL